ncbi:aminoacyl-tRNA hydrolase [bacterium]|nr:aminoacyl-tRNA hydrolase [bacterium]
MKLIIGLGNPGEKYSKTRHNAGFMVVDFLVADLGLQWKFEKKLNAETARSEDTIFAKPQTFMNSSGEAVSKVVNFYNIDVKEDLLVIHDDVDLEFGVTKKQFARGTAGHKGVEDIVSRLKTQEFYRLRIGVGRSPNPAVDTEDWVLMNFTANERASLSTQKPHIPIS